MKSSRRAEILLAVQREFHENGFRGASLDAIRAETGLTKVALGYAVVEEVIRAEILETWVRPLIGAEDPIRTVQAILRGQSERRSGSSLRRLAQEMSPLDEGFRRRIEEVYRLWRGAIAEALERGRIAGSVRKDMNARTAAAFLVASFEGVLAQDPSALPAAAAGLHSYLEGLRVRSGIQTDQW